MHIRVQPFWLPKRGNSGAEFEDAFKPRRQAERTRVEDFRCAIADGATESSFSDLWARLLVERHYEAPFRDCENLRRRAQSLSAHWWGHIRGKSLPWYAETKAHEGAFSSFLGLWIHDIRSDSIQPRAWQSIAIGDSCLFHVREDALRKAFPLEHSQDFGNSPVLLSSNLSRNRIVWESTRSWADEWEDGDTFFLATDALAAWFLRSHERGEKPWRTLLRFVRDKQGHTNDEFREWIGHLRDDGAIRNDDVTLLVVQIHGDI